VEVVLITILMVVASTSPAGGVHTIVSSLKHGALDVLGQRGMDVDGVPEHV
jgi:hypothetical protein